MPLLTSANLELDLAEDLALGKEWQLGYWKHPPLPWWLADLGYRITGHIGVVYALGPLAVVACFIGVYLLSRDIVGPVQALIATLSLAGIHFYNYSAVKFAHDQMQLPFWALTGLFLYRALAHGRMLNWVLAGAMMALCFWSKYAAFALGVSIALFLADRSGRTPQLSQRRAVSDGGSLSCGDRAECLVAGRFRLPADELCHRTRKNRRALVPVHHLSGALAAESGLLHFSDADPVGTHVIPATPRR